MPEEIRPGLQDVIVARTEVSTLDLERERIVVRGYDLLELARAARFPDVTHLLLRGHLPSPAEQALADPSPEAAEAMLLRTLAPPRSPRPPTERCRASPCWSRTRASPSRARSCG